MRFWVCLCGNCAFELWLLLNKIQYVSIQWEPLWTHKLQCILYKKGKETVLNRSIFPCLTASVLISLIPLFLFFSFFAKLSEWQIPITTVLCHHLLFPFSLPPSPTLLPQCIICYDNAIDCVMTPCGHQVCCLECSANLSACPVCNNRGEFIKIFRPWPAFSRAGPSIVIWDVFSLKV